MKFRNALIITAGIAFLLTGPGCGKKAAESASGALATGKTGSAKPAIASPDNLAAKIFFSYELTLTQVADMLKDKKPAAEVKPMLELFKAATINLMVGLGKNREALAPEDRATVDSLLSLKLGSVSTELFKRYQDGQAAYQNDRELFNLIADFNIITQYANFDLLKKQLPDEAKRLGIQ